MAQVTAIFSKYYQSVEALNSIHGVMEMPTDVSKKAQYLHRPNLLGNIDFKQVDFEYPNQAVTTLKSASFSIRKGEKVGLIGRTGCGKSTIAKLLIGLYRPSQGSIYIDNTDYLQINPADLRKQVSYVPQDVVLFLGSVKENILFGSRYVDDEALLKAAKISGVTSFTDNHPEGFDRSVGERGSRLSAGQRQSIAIARALLSPCKILVMDEPTASMDDGFEKLIRHNLKNYLKDDMTLILITHKTSMLELVDRLIVVDNSSIVADGPKNAVIKALKGGLQVQKAKDK